MSIVVLLKVMLYYLQSTLLTNLQFIVFVTLLFIMSPHKNNSKPKATTKFTTNFTTDEVTDSNCYIIKVMSIAIPCENDSAIFTICHHNSCYVLSSIIS
jgi:hypothetical protein